MPDTLQTQPQPVKRSGGHILKERGQPYNATPAGRRQGGRASWAARTPEQKAEFKRHALGQPQGHTQAEYKAKAAAIERGYPKVMPSNRALGGGEFKSFAQKIRHKTKDGWELVEAVYEVFQRAREAQADSLVLDAATWLADRGFGKPVQVGQLLDAEGNAVAFTLWSPATHEQTDVITLTKEEREGDGPARYLPPGSTVEPPALKVLEPKDGYAHGPARAWGVGEAEPRRGE